MDSKYGQGEKNGDNKRTNRSGEDARVQAICNAVWTDAVKTAFQTAFDASVPS